MCAPLSYQGQILGVIYVGNNSFVNAFDQKSLEVMTIYSSQAAMLVQNALHINALKKRTKILQESLELTKFGGLIGGCASMQEVFVQIERFAQTDANILIVGETGTGKEHIAKELHLRSLRKDKPFVTINCSTLPQILENELFGYVRGAFLGALTSRIGKIQLAHTGTLFLDDIQAIPGEVQIKLLQVVQDFKVFRIGDHKGEPVDIRIISSATKNFFELIEANEFREDLYYRLNVVEITVPPLRERGNDVLVIANFFVQKYAKIYGKEVLGLDEKAQNLLLNYNWPGNVRQLENRIRRAVVMTDDHRISALDLDIPSNENSKIVPLSEALEKFRTRYINESLERNAGNRTKTAQELGVDPRTIFRHLESKKREFKGE